MRARYARGATTTESLAMNEAQYDRFEDRAELRLDRAERLGRYAVVANCLSGMLIVADVGFRTMTETHFSEAESNGILLAAAVTILSLKAHHTANAYKDYVIRRVMHENDKLNGTGY